jgi:hypothetical protein
MGKSAGNKIVHKLRDLSINTLKKKPNKKSIVVPAFVGGLRGQVLSKQALREYARLATEATKAPRNSEQNFLNFLEALTNSNTSISGENRGQKIGAPTRRLIEKVVFPALQGPAPEPNPVVNGFINEIRRLNLSGPIDHFIPSHAANIKIIVNRAKNLSDPKRSINIKHENSKRLGAAMSRVTNKILGQVYKNGPGQPTKQGVIMNGFFRGFLSQNKNGSATWASKFLGNRLGNRNLSPEIKRILLTLVARPTNTNTQRRQLITNIEKLYQKVSNKNDFLTGLKVLTAPRPLLSHAASTAWSSIAGPPSVKSLALRTAAQLVAGTQRGRSAAYKVGNVAYRTISKLGASARQRHKE